MKKAELLESYKQLMKSRVKRDSIDLYVRTLAGEEEITVYPDVEEKMVPIS